MEYEELGRSGLRVSKIGLGTYGIELAPREEALASLRTGIDLGINLIDTAEIYGSGKSEEIVGEAIKPYDREELVIVTKVSGRNLEYEKVKRSAVASARRLGTHIDVYLIHWPNPQVPIKETIRSMEELRDEGIIRQIGVSNFSLDQLIEAREALSKGDIVTNQVEYSLNFRAPEMDLLPYCQRERITLMAYSPLDRGKLARRPPERLLKVAKALGKTHVQVALNWLISKPMVVAIPKASKVHHVKEIVGSTGWRIPEDLLEELEAL